eukprot:TRINITY_DN329_c0_g1_i1.p1 TRINITY_DN329_c0_g1~~TRINITY_DN329_c0_g1_i1.p1  ORF type:complete len:1017 (-),score=248.45 TRINITY_DN329_c0_g1_i1:535-3585(-)
MAVNALVDVNISSAISGGSEGIHDRICTAPTHLKKQSHLKTAFLADGFSSAFSSGSALPKWKGESRNRRTLVLAKATIGGGKDDAEGSAIPGGTADNGTLTTLSNVAPTKENAVQALQAALAAAEKRAAAAEREKQNALEIAAMAEAKSEAYAASMVATTEEAMAEVEAAKDAFKAELEQLLKEKISVEEELALVKNESIDLAVKVERRASMAVEQATAFATESARMRMAEAKTDAAAAAATMEGRIREAANEAAASVIEEAKLTIDDALAAAELAKEQARNAAAALQDRMGLLDDLAQAQAEVIRGQEAIAQGKAKFLQLQAEGHQLQFDVKVALLRAEAAESRIGSFENAMRQMQESHESSAMERDLATKRALESLQAASSAREEAAMVAYKAETDSLRAAVESASKAEKAKEQAMQRRFEALERSLIAAEETALAWKQRSETVEEILAATRSGTGEISVAREEILAGSTTSVTGNGGRMDVMLGDSSSKWKLLAEGPRRERPEWLQRKSTAGMKLPPSLRRFSPDEELSLTVGLVPLELPKPEDVWSISEHRVTDDAFTKEAEKRELQLKEVEEQREKLEKALQAKDPPAVVTTTPSRRLKTPEEMEDKQESGTGTGREVVFQGFNWESNRRRWYLEFAPKAADLAACGITTVWLPPPTESVAPQGYMPVDLYNLNSAYGTVEELKFCIDELHKYDIQVLGDVVLNHRCASKQGPDGVWNIFGGKLNWSPEAIVRDDPNFAGRGNPSYGDFFHAAPNIDHSQEFVRRDIKEWLQWLRAEVGYDGWRLDFVRGFWGGHVKEYIAASNPAFSIGEYWDSMAYEGGTVCYNQDAHRQRIINWINATAGTSSAFDVTTKGILHSAVHNEYWRLIDPQGKPPGVMGWWPSRAVTFLENHDTGSTQGHWPFPRDKVLQGYAYILTHPGTPVVFYDHFYDWGLHDQIADLVKTRSRLGIHCRSSVRIMQATAEGYVAQVGDRLVLKLGSLDWNPAKQNDLAGRWERFMDRGAEFQLWEKK